MTDQLTQQQRYTVFPIANRTELPVMTALGFITGIAIGLTWALPAYIFLMIVGVRLAFIDAATKRLPNRLVGLAYIGTVSLLLLPAAIDGMWGAYFGALAFGAALFAIYFLLAFANPRGMGMGDVKLAGVLGIALGWFGLQVWLIGAVLPFLIAATVGIVAMATGRATRKTKIPFGPAMLAGTWIAIILGAINL